MDSRHTRYNMAISNVRQPRTSTPIREIEESSPSSDSVSEFFYQSWKSDLESDESTGASQPRNPTQPVNQQPIVYYSRTVVIVNPMMTMQQPFFTPTTCYPTVGYRPDGTYGFLFQGCYWPSWQMRW